jgi:hypothetical protein
MVRISQKNKRKRRNSLLSQNKFLFEVCVAAGISLCDLTNLHATKDGMSPQRKPFTKDHFDLQGTDFNDRNINRPQTHASKTYNLDELENRLEVDGGLIDFDDNGQDPHHRAVKSKRATGSQPTRSQPIKPLENTQPMSNIDRSKSLTESRYLDLVGRKAPLSYPKPKPPSQKNHADGIKVISRPIAPIRNNMQYNLHHARQLQDIQESNAKNYPRQNYAQHYEQMSQTSRSFTGSQAESHRTSTIPLHDVNRNVYPENNARSYYQHPSQYQQTQSWTSTNIVNDNNVYQDKAKPWQYSQVNANNQIPLPSPRSYPTSAVRSNVKDINDINDSLRRDHHYSSQSDSIHSQHVNNALITRSNGYVTSHVAILPSTAHDALLNERLDQVSENVF